ncbi:MAG: nitrilase [Betaproteobacteria bacterium RIFCSPHIGHO2_12_FULL_69_13]|nr:MAG: nitrilase [Betaproteobacteria bacterium RIFCSPHIGHO2_12_FULL_69_13]OGA68968.1 MAG: nitrilase [Betaproteobacteria bacterium RIFCSPLOWO2_12_FULL_68_20]
MHGGRFRAAVVQAGSVPFDTAATVDKTLGLIGRCAERGIELAVFPEAFVGGYPKGITFGAVVGARRPEGRDWFARYHAGAIAVPGRETEALGKACMRARLHAVVGVIERDGGTLYCTVVFFGPDGGLLGKHRKLMPTAAERLVWGYGDGSTLPVLETPHGRLGAVICWENYMPMLRMAMYAKNVQIYCAPTADDRGTWLPSMQMVALEGRCFVLSACQYIARGAYPADYPCELSNDPGFVLMRGGSCVVDPLGGVLVAPHFQGEAILEAELDPLDIARGKYDFDVAGHYARPDVFRLSVNEAPQPPVAFGARGGG